MCVCVSDICCDFGLMGEERIGAYMVRKAERPSQICLVAGDQQGRDPNQKVSIAIGNIICQLCYLR